MFTFTPSGTCSRRILIDTEGDIIKSVQFEGGCSGNLSGISRLMEGMRIQDAIERMKGIECRNGTSCPDQLAIALEAMQKKNAASE